MLSQKLIIYGQGMESVAHLFLHRDFASSLWYRLLRSGVFWCFLQSLGGSLHSSTMGGLCGGFFHLPFCGQSERRRMLEFLWGPL